MGFNKVSKHDQVHSTNSRFDCSVNEQPPIWPDLAASRECFQTGSCPPSSADRFGTKALEEKGHLHRFSLSEDLYRFSGDNSNKRVEHVVTSDEYEARIKNLEARLALQIEKLERLIASQVSSHESTNHNEYSNRPTNLSRPAGGAHYVFDSNGNGQLIGPNGEHQYNLVDGERVWLSNTHRSSTKDDTSAMQTGCSNGSCRSCSGCLPRLRYFK